jgi:hypothetical protein
MTFAEKIISFNQSLSLELPLPPGVIVMNPYTNPETFIITKQFYKKYYSDHQTRTLILGINPGRFGGGITGIPFTDPVKLEKYCGIQNELPKKSELSADFIYRMIEVCGGPQNFYARFYISAISPLGFTKDGKNLNYYDIKELHESLLDFIVGSIQKQLTFGINEKVCYCLGEGDNFKFLSRLNKSYHFFQKIIPLAHPRFIMQYKRKKLDEYVNDYLKKFESCES